MPRLIYTPRARQDLIRLCSFIAEKNPQAAQRTAKAILESAGLLRRNPKIGRPVAELPPDFRELVIPFGAAGYLLRYRIVEEQDEVVILAIRHPREVGYE
jgi:plasmid stabilization system protein ParE